MYRVWKSGRSGRKYLFFILGKWNDYGMLRAKDQNDIGRGKSGGVYRGDVTVKIEVEDLQAGDTYSGIQQVFYHVAAEENVQADKEEILFQKKIIRHEERQDGKEQLSFRRRCSTAMM